MKKLLLLFLVLIPLIALSQPTSLPNKVDVYKGLVAGDRCRNSELPVCEKAAKDLNKIIQDQSGFIIDYTDEYQKLQRQKDSIYQEKEKLAIEIEKLKAQKKRISIGPYVGLDFFNSRTSGGLSVQYSIFRF